ncbi:MAG: dTDP-4-dehydrorhamnose reductase [Bacteroidales bacterium]|nr:dTDP-4-dehydrorhamnose reductase [Bacteroidales bacterium]
MNILVTGANGQLGTELRNVSLGSKHHFIFTDVSSLPNVETVYLDITNIDAIRIVADSERVDMIVNCAAYTDVNKAEDDLAFASLLNATAAENLAKVCNERGATLIHVSTDYVFNGEGHIPYKEEAEAEPLGAYGSTKYAGEVAIQKSGCKHLIFRTAWLYSPYGKNFVKTMLKLTSERDVVSVVFDQVGTPTYALDLANVIMKVIEEGQTDKQGIYHFTDEGVTSWYDFTVAIAELSGHDKCMIKPCHTDEFPTKAARPHYSVLDKTKVKETFGVDIPHWRVSLKECLKRLGELK